MMLTTQFFGMKIQRYMHEHGISRETLAKVAAKAFRNGSKNENAWRRTPLSEDQILDAPVLAAPADPVHVLLPGEGGVALVLASPRRPSALSEAPVYLRSAVLRSRPFGSFEVFNPGLAAERGDSPSVAAAAGAFEMAGIGPSDIDVVQVQDTESGAEVMHLAECGFCEDGEQEDLIQSGGTEIDGRLPVNTDGGCLANGEPIGASGLRQVYESVLQLRGGAGERQVPGDPQTAFTHVYGAPASPPAPSSAGSGAPTAPLPAVSRPPAARSSSTPGSWVGTRDGRRDASTSATTTPPAATRKTRL